jgi:hypothetical protein
LTIDIDLLIASEDIMRAAAIAKGLGFDDVSGWVKLPENKLGICRLFGINKLAGNSFLTLDLLEADSPQNLIFVDRESFLIEGHSIQSLSKNALITMKASSERTKDKLDIELLNDGTD